MLVDFDDVIIKHCRFEVFQAMKDNPPYAEDSIYFITLQQVNNTSKS